MGKGFNQFLVPLWMMLLVLPVTTYSTIPTQTEPLQPIQAHTGYEVLLHRDDGWGYTEWEALQNAGLSPLRLISTDSLLVWSKHSAPQLDMLLFDDIIHDSWSDPLHSLPFTQTTTVSDWRVLLEPRLPIDGVEGVASTLLLDGFVLAEGNSPNSILTYLTNNHPPNSPLPLELNLIGVEGDSLSRLDELRRLDGVLWIEESLSTEGRNSVSASVSQHSSTTQHPGWLYGLDGSGIVIGVADSGIDRDHGCFANATEIGGVGAEGDNLTGTPSDSHRKLVWLNETFDDWDTAGHSNYRHGTHVAASLVCRMVDAQRNEESGNITQSIPNDITSVSHGATLVFQDIVDGSGWVPPNIDELLWEAAVYGAVIHSDSWGDNTESYTERSLTLDGWGMENPWSLAFIAPGNNGKILEPANAKNIVSVGATVRSDESVLYSNGGVGPTQEGLRGITIVSPGVSILSAGADGSHDSYNTGARSISGTSMSTPQAAGVTAIIQQMVEGGWLTSSEDRDNLVEVSELTPVWASLHQPGFAPAGNISLGDGFTPSGSLLRALLTLSAKRLDGGEQGGHTLGTAPDTRQGWGRPSLSRLVDWGGLTGELNDTSSVVVPANDVWVWDSYRLVEPSVDGWLGKFQTRMEDARKEGGPYETPLQLISRNGWNGSGAIGPFLAQNESITWRIPVIQGEDVEVRLSFAARPFPNTADDLDLVVRLPNGSFFHGGEWDGNQSQLFPAGRTTQDLGERLEGVEGVRIPSSLLDGVNWVDIEVKARGVGVGNQTSTVGTDGDLLGFALAVKGVSGSPQLSTFMGVSGMIDDNKWDPSTHEIEFRWLGQLPSPTHIEWFDQNHTLLGSNSIIPSLEGDNILSAPPNFQTQLSLKQWKWIHPSVTDPADLVANQNLTTWPHHMLISWNNSKINITLQDNLSLPNEEPNWFSPFLPVELGILDENLLGSLFDNASSYNNNTPLPGECSSAGTGGAFCSTLEGGGGGLGLTDDLVVGAAKEGGPSADEREGRFTFPVNHLLTLDNVVIEAARLRRVTTDDEMGWNNNHFSISSSWCELESKEGGGYAEPNDCDWTTKDTLVIADLNDEGGNKLLFKLDWPAQYSGNLSIDLNFSSGDDYYQVAIPVVVERNWNGSLTNYRAEGVTRWLYFDGVNPPETGRYDERVDFVWNFSQRPGYLSLAFDLGAPNSVAASFEDVDGGAKQSPLLPNGMYIPACSPNPMTDESELHQFNWTWNGVRVPPILTDCVGNTIESSGRWDLNWTEGVPPTPNSVSIHNDLIRNLTTPHAAVISEFTLAGFDHPWWNDSGVKSTAPNNLTCTLGLESNGIVEDIHNCDEWWGEILRLNHIQSEWDLLRINFSWIETGTMLQQESFHEYYLASPKLANPTEDGYRIEVMSEGEWRLSWVDPYDIPESGWPLILRGTGDSTDPGKVVFLPKNGYLTIKAENCEALQLFIIETGSHQLNWVVDFGDLNQSGAFVFVLDLDDKLDWEPMRFEGAQYTGLVTIKGDGVNFTAELFSPQNFIPSKGCVPSTIEGGMSATILGMLPFSMGVALLLAILIVWLVRRGKRGLIESPQGIPPDPWNE